MVGSEGLFTRWFNLASMRGGLGGEMPKLECWSCENREREWTGITLGLASEVLTRERFVLALGRMANEKRAASHMRARAHERRHRARVAMRALGVDVQAQSVETKLGQGGASADAEVAMACPPKVRTCPSPIVCVLRVCS